MQLNSEISFELKTRKLYAADFKILGIEYLAVVRTHLDKNKIISSKPYPTNKWKSLLEEQHKDWEHQIDAQSQAPIYLKYINSKIGFGVFADTLIKSFDIVGEYTGLLCVEDDSKNEESFDYAIDVGNYYTGESGTPLALYIDAEKSGNFTRFINHSYMPNVCSHSIYNKNDGLWHVMMRANKDICQDAQLLINYDVGYWNTRNIQPVDLSANP